MTSLSCRGSVREYVFVFYRHKKAIYIYFFKQTCQKTFKTFSKSWVPSLSKWVRYLTITGWWAWASFARSMSVNFQLPPFCVHYRVILWTCTRLLIAYTCTCVYIPCCIPTVQLQHPTSESKRVRCIRFMLFQHRKCTIYLGAFTISSALFQAQLFRTFKTFISLRTKCVFNVLFCFKRSEQICFMGLLPGIPLSKMLT